MMKPLLIGITACLVLVLAGCNEKDKYTLVFSHALHVKDNGIACADCHGQIKEGRLAWPGHQVCVDCHDAVTKTNEISATTCGMCHKEKNLREIAKYSPPAKTSAGTFTHTPALKSECASCHEEVLTSKLDHVPVLSRSDIIRIRQKSHDSNRSCDICHTDMSPLVAPANHKKNWTRRHGGEASSADPVCGVCHKEQTCKECHQANKPESHNNNLWRTKTHGIEASWERAKCKVCHEEDSCVLCHSQERPRSHNAGWRANHCQNCHTSESMGTGCATCHPGGISAHPNPHTANWRTVHCNQCHPGDPEWNQCILCHEGGISAHPDPHGAGWLSQHCNQCHIGSPGGDQCLICHVGIPGHPDPHPAGWLSQHCNQCHVGSPGGDQCLICHVGISGHPDPHPAGWQIQHCNQCHAGTPQAAQCQICHGNTPHTNPHPALWSYGHCLNCHASGPTTCSQCHPVAGESIVALHDNVWPGWHNTDGFNAQTDCFADGCHNSGMRLKRSASHKPLAKPLIAPVAPRR